MSKTSATPYRECPPWDVCDEQPCRHTLCRDPDWLADMEDYHSNREFHRTLWNIFRHPSTRAAIQDDLSKYADKLDRCQRIMDKREQINAEIRASHLRLMRMAGYDGPDPTTLGRKEGIEVETPPVIKKVQDSVNRGEDSNSQELKLESV